MSISMLKTWIAVVAALVVISAKTIVPTFFIDPTILAITNERIACMRNESALNELKLLQHESATEFFRGHELYAHAFFVESGFANPHRRSSAEEAEFEYIPLLPLFWRIKSSHLCGYSPMIQCILKIQAYLVERDRRSPSLTVRPKFTVASTFNMRTELGTGMPTQIRKGEVWTAVSAFVMSLSIGHYERYPQCPDLLRKSWKYVVELPYVPMNTRLVSSLTASLITTTTTAMGGALDTSVSTHSVNINTDSANNDNDNSRKYMFHFSGNFNLYGCEMVCSVRNAVLNVVDRPDTLIVNTTVGDANRGVDNSLFHAVKNSAFCLVTKGDSYSTSFFYHAIAGGCIPVVVSDWFTFAFPWAVPYELFTVRVSETDFTANTNHVLDFIRDGIGANPALLRTMRGHMRRYRHMLSWDPIEYQSTQYDWLINNDMYTRKARQQQQQQQQHPSLATTASASHQSKNFHTILPLELMLLELRYNQAPYQFYNNIPCHRPYMCRHDRSVPHNTSRTSNAWKGDYTFYEKSRNKDAAMWYSGDDSAYSGSSNNNGGGDSSGGGDSTPTTAVTAETTPVSSTSTSTSSNSNSNSNTYRLVDSGMQVNYLYIPPTFEDKRSHLCKHSPRLIGHYKIVFFMQCVRILWPLSPGQFKPVDNTGRFEIALKTNNGASHTVTTVDSGTGQSSSSPSSTAGATATAVLVRSKISVSERGISEADFHYVRAFHNISRPHDWALTNYPVAMKPSTVLRNVNSLNGDE